MSKLKRFIIIFGLFLATVSLVMLAVYGFSKLIW